MRIAITGGTGFVGSHLARDLARRGHETVLVSRGVDPRNADVLGLPGASCVRSSVVDEEALVAAFDGCDAVAHCAGINRQIGSQRYDAVHVGGTRAVTSAAKRSGVARIALISYLRARPNAPSAYLRSKWEAEEIVRNSGLDFLIVKPGIIFGPGDHLIDHTSRSLGTFRLFGSVGLRDTLVRPVAVEDVVTVVRVALTERELLGRSISVLGPEEIRFAEAARRVARAMDVGAMILPIPVSLLYLLGWISEQFMTIPLVSVAQVRLLQEGGIPVPGAEFPPHDLTPRVPFSPQAIRPALPRPARFRLKDLRWPLGQR